MDFNYEKIEQEIFQYVDQIKEFLSPEIWNNIVLNCSKNEVLILWLLFRSNEVNMTQIAEYVHVPLNTATGIISRMEQKSLVSRERSIDDKRIVTIQLGERGKEQIQALLKEFMYYGEKVTESFSTEEIKLFFHMLQKVIDIMKVKSLEDSKKQKIRKITID